MLALHPYFDRSNSALIAACVALLSFSIPAAAQRAAVDGPVAETYQFSGHYRLKLATGEITPEAFVVDPPESLGCGNTIINSFVNIDASGLFYTWPAEMVDWGVISKDTESDIVTEFTFGYASAMLDTSMGGPGASITLNFYENYAGPCGIGSTGSADRVAPLQLTGLPASPDGGNYGYFLTVDLRGGDEFILPEGNFGYGTLTGPSERTGPIQSLAGEPTGSTSMPDNNGQVTALDQWSPDLVTGTCFGPLFLNVDASTGFLVGSHYLLLRKANAPATPPAEAVIRNDAAGSNPLALFPGGTPVIGSAFSLIAASTGPGEQGAFLAGFSGAADLPTSFGSLLIDVTDPGGEQLAPAGLAGPHAYVNGFVGVTVDLPIDVNLCGFELSVQAAQFGTGLQLTNAIDLTFGLR